MFIRFFRKLREEYQNYIAACMQADTFVALHTISWDRFSEFDW